MTTIKSEKRKTLMLLDGNAIIHRAFHGVPPLSLADGTPTNAVYGFTSTLLTVITKFQPDYIVATFDLPGKTFRHDMFADYKGKRKELDEDLIPQFELVKEVVRAMNIEIAEKENYEADDVIGTLSVQATKEGVDTVIVTGDRDTFQLVDDHVQVFTMSRGINDMRLYDAEGVQEKMGVTVEQVIDFKGICGDSSDNIPGVRGIGEKGAQQLLADYGDLDGVYAHIDEVKGAMQKKLIEHKELAYLSKELGTIALDVPVQLDLPASLSADIDMDGARAVFQKFHFLSLVKRLDKSSAREKGESKDGTQKKTAKKTTTAAAKKDSGDAHVLDTVAAKEFLGVCEGREVYVVPDIDDARLHGLSLVAGDRRAYIPYTEDLSHAIDHFLTAGVAQIIVYDVKALWHAFHAIDHVLPIVWRDTALLAYCARTGQKVDMEHLVFDILGEEVETQEGGSQMTLELRDDAHTQRSGMGRALQIQGITAVLTREMDAISQDQKESREDALTVWDVFHTLEMPLARILFDMEIAGIAFDGGIFEKIATKTNALLTTLSADIHGHADSDFNINSTKQLRVVLFETLGLPTANIKKTKTGFSTASSELEKMRDLHPIIAMIESYRELFKLKTTYIDALPKLVASDGRIHTTYNQRVTSTGRLSSSDPNLQNIPVRSEAGRALREAFVARPGTMLISADYSQIELRAVAHVARDTAMTEAFAKGADIHTFTSARVMGREMSDITKEERSRAKELNFGLIYGMGASSFAKAAEIDMAQAKEFIEKYFTTFSGVKDYMDQTKISAHEDGYVETLLGRRYYVNGITSKNAMMRAGAERAAINMPIQGLAAEIMKLAMIAVDGFVHENYPDGSVRMLLQIHDEIILEAPEAIADTVTQEIVGVMDGVYELCVPLLADAEVGRHWGGAVEYLSM